MTTINWFNDILAHFYSDGKKEKILGFSYRWKHQTLNEIEMFINGMKGVHMLTMFSYSPTSLFTLSVLLFHSLIVAVRFSDQAKEDSLIAFIMAFVHILIPVWNAFLALIVLFSPLK